MGPGRRSSANLLAEWCPACGSTRAISKACSCRAKYHARAFHSIWMDVAQHDWRYSQLRSNSLRTGTSGSCALEPKSKRAFIRLCSHRLCVILGLRIFAGPLSLSLQSCRERHQDLGRVATKPSFNTRIERSQHVHRTASAHAVLLQLLEADSGNW